jgi:hypothetical protein
MRAVYVEPEADPIVFEVQSPGGSRERDVTLLVYGVEEASDLAVTVESLPAVGTFQFKTGKPVTARVGSQAGEPVRVTVPTTCTGGQAGEEQESLLTLRLTYPGEEPEPFALSVVASCNRVLPLWQVLAEEYTALKADWRDEVLNHPVLNDPKASDGRKLQELLGIAQGKTGDGLAALCISGGGIRSATFNLGTLQGLAESGLLGRFDYLSSSSGGGFITSWLSGWIHREGREEVLQELGNRPTDPQKPEPEPIEHLRRYSNYLTPKLGALSADAWTFAAIVIRNLLLNWLVLLPLLAAALMLPLLAVARVEGVGGAPSPIVLYWLAVLTGGVALVFTNLMRASVAPLPDERQAPWKTAFFELGLLPFLVATVLMAWSVAEVPADGLTFLGALRWSALWALGMPVAAVLLAGFLQAPIMNRQHASLRGDVISILLSGSVITLLYALVVARWAGPLLASRYPLYPLLAPILFLGPVLLGKTLFIAFSSFAEERGYPSDLGDADREWWARWAGWILICTTVWMVLAATVFFGPTLLELARMKVAAAISTGALGWITSHLGKSTQTPAKADAGDDGGTGGWRSWAMALAAPLFGLLLLLLVSAVTQDLLRLVFGGRAAASGDGWVPPFKGTPWQVLGAALALAALGLFMGRFVNVNRFSLQAMYRNRLVRAYLGASNTRRRPNPFTGFDPDDNLRLHSLRRNRPLPVINVTLNLVAGKELAWQQRKAESFTATPLHCGSACLGYRRASIYGGERGISLGTAVATSGAAANPNAGFNSSPAITFIMTLFNARLGAWLGNPGPVGADTYTRSGPRSSGRVLLAEAFGHTDDRHPYVNLSDGGHFDNLGIYEMVRRRCRFILVCDAGGDPSCHFGDLGNAIRKIRIDLGIPIDFEDRIRIYPRSSEIPPNARYCALGRVRYSEVDGAGVPDGTLIYVKPTIYESRYEPYDVYNYARSSPTFPQEGTADQWFSESQFESYRALGQATLQAMIGWGPGARAPVPSLEEFEELVKRYIRTD